MGVCNWCKAEPSMNIEEKQKSSYSHYKSAPQTTTSSEKLSRKMLNPSSDPSHKLLQHFYNQNKLDIDPEILILYMEVIRGDHQSLKEINLKFRTIIPKQSKFLSLILPYCRELRKINIWRTNLGDEGIHYLTKSLICLPNVIQISLDENNISEQGFSYFSKGLVNLKKLKILSLHQNIIGFQGSKALAIAFKELWNLEELYLDSTKLTNEQLNNLLQGITGIRSLKKLGLAYNLLDGKCIPLLREFLEKMKIKELFLSGNQFTEGEAQMLSESFSDINIIA